MAKQVEFFFDVSCPFAWVTSRWIIEVSKVRDIEITWSPMSLSVINRDRTELPAEYRAKMEANWGPARVFVSVATKEPEAVGRLYTVMGDLIHNQGNAGKSGYGAYDPVIVQALEKAGLDLAYAEVANSDVLDKSLEEFQERAMELVGDEVGTPVIRIGETAFFGPVLTRIPRGEEAGEIFDAAFRLASYPHFFEIKRSRTESPDFS